MSVRAGTWLLALSAVLVAGCSGEEAPASLPPLPSATPSQTPPTATGVPPEAAPVTPQAASAFAKHFLKVVDEAFQAGEPDLITSLSAPGCGGCESLASAVMDMVTRRQRQVGGEYVDVQAATAPFSGGDALVDLTYRRNPGQQLDEQGLIISSDPAVARTSAQMRIVRQGSGWLVQGYRVVAG